MPFDLAPGIHPDIPAEKYHSLPYLGSSDVKLLVKKTPRHFKHLRDNPPEKKNPDRTGQIGSVAHLLALEPHLFKERVVMVREDDWRTKDAKATRDEAFAKGLLPILEPDLQDCFGMQEELIASIGNLLTEGASTELSMVALDPVFGVLVKARIDSRKPGEHFDYKTTEDASAEAFSRRMNDNDHHIQAWHYPLIEEILTGKRPRWTWIVQEQSPPYVVQIYRPTPATLSFGQMDRDKGMERYVRALESGVWQGYSRKVEFAELPGYRTRRIQEGIEAGEYKITGAAKRRGPLTAEQVQTGIDAQAP